MSVRCFVLRIFIAVRLNPKSGNRQNDLIGRPEPSVDEFWEELWLVTPVKVALAAGSPEKWNLRIMKYMKHLKFVMENHHYVRHNPSNHLYASKLRLRPDVQKKGTCLIWAAINNHMISFDYGDDIDDHTLPSMKPFTQSYSCRVSKETRSMQRFLKNIRVRDGHAVAANAE